MSKDKRLLNPFEREVMEKLLDGNHPVLAALRSQLGFCEVSNREFTGHGFFTNLRVERSVEPAPVPRSRIQVRDVGGKIEGLKYGAGFVLFVTDGYLDLLEGFSYEEPWPPVISKYSLFYEGSRAKDPGNIKMPDN